MRGHAGMAIHQAAADSAGRCVPRAAMAPTYRPRPRHAVARDFACQSGRVPLTPLSVYEYAARIVAAAPEYPS